MTDPTSDDLLARVLAAALIDAQQRYRTRRGFGAYVTPLVPAEVIEEFAASAIPVFRKFADAAVEAKLRDPEFLANLVATVKLRMNPRYVEALANAPRTATGPGHSVTDVFLEHARNLDAREDAPDLAASEERRERIVRAAAEMVDRVIKHNPRKGDE